MIEGKNPCDMTDKEAIEIIKVARAEVEWEYPMEYAAAFDRAIDALEQKTGHCKDCKWWKDSDGLYRRGGHAESQCPINRREVFDGNGYCYMFELRESKE